MAARSKLHRICLTSLVLLIPLFAGLEAQYLPNWDSLGTRPLPSWYDESKVGIFIHWSVNSALAIGGKSTSCRFWQYLTDRPQKAIVEYWNANFPPNARYEDVANDFKAELFDPDAWATLFQKAGAKYVVFVTKHHEGWNNWKSKYQWNWNSVDQGPHRDIVGDLTNSIRNLTDIHMGLYYSLLAWYHPDYIQDLANNFTTRAYPPKVAIPQLKELVETYKPEVLWADGYKLGNDSYWGSLDFLAWLYNESPVKDTVVVNDRWGYGDVCKHGGFLTCGDRHTPGKLQPAKWESCIPIDGASWCYRRDAPLQAYMTTKQILTHLVKTVSCGGNFLFDIGPTHDGRIIPLIQERLLAMGAWLDINGEAIYASRPWRAQNDTVSKGVWYTMKKTETAPFVYANVVQWPDTGILTLGAPLPSNDTTVTMLGVARPLTWVTAGVKGGINVTMSTIPFNMLPSTEAWTLKLTNVS